ncbi:MAG: ABC transporter ATP-binding protein [Syntrophaceae bacterium]|nr:ABC transporter ATP-binding protein [Syntrophaceae bacterium]
MLELIQVDRFFGHFQALKQINLKVEEGEFRGLIGPNGSGKTTLFNVISGVYKASAGQVKFLGQDVTGFTPDKICHAGITRSFQIPRPFREMSVVENVMLGSLFGKGTKNLAPQEPLAEALHWLEFVGLKVDQHTMPGELTAGNLRRLELARALATHPKLLLADEIMSGLNQEEILQASKVLKKIREELKITIIWVEHIMSALMNLVERVTILDYGQIIAEGTPEEVSRNPIVIEAYLGEEETAGHA